MGVSILVPLPLTPPPPEMCMRFAHILFRAWVDKVEQESAHWTPEAGVMMPMGNDSAQAVMVSDEVAGEAAPVTPPAPSPSPVGVALPPAPPPPVCMSFSLIAPASLPITIPAHIGTRGLSPSAGADARQGHLNMRGLSPSVGVDVHLPFWQSLGPWRIGESAPALKQLADDILASVGKVSASSDSPPISFR